MLNEADTRAKLIDPKLLQRGWTEDKIKRDVLITPGKIVDENGKRQKGKNFQMKRPLLQKSQRKNC